MNSDIESVGGVQSQKLWRWCYLQIPGDGWHTQNHLKAWRKKHINGDIEDANSTPKEKFLSHSQTVVLTAWNSTEDANCAAYQGLMGTVKKGNAILRETMISKVGWWSFPKRGQLKRKTIPSLGLCKNRQRATSGPQAMVLQALAQSSGEQSCPPTFIFHSKWKELHSILAGKCMLLQFKLSTSVDRNVTEPAFLLSH